MAARTRSAFDPFATLVHLRANGRARPVRRTPGVFRPRTAGRRRDG